jgi:hypothetical protein
MAEMRTAYGVCLLRRVEEEAQPGGIGGAATTRTSWASSAGGAAEEPGSGVRLKPDLRLAPVGLSGLIG